MSFGTIEDSRYRGQPTNLFHIRYGAAPNSYYAYTDAEQQITNDGIVYEPLAISRSKIVITGTMDRTAVEVRCTLNTPMAELFRVYPPSQVVNITMYQGHLSDPDKQFLVAFAGRVISAKRAKNELVLSCEPVTTSMRRVGLRRHYQYSCMHALYGDWCRASKDAATKLTTAASIAGTSLTLPAGWETDERALKYLHGMVEWTNGAGDVEIRSIIRVQNTNTLLLSGNLADLKPGMEVKVILGCNHGLYLNPDGSLASMTDCHFLHGNIQNFGGCGFIPTKNPIGMANNYY
ncbi:DUF2163 domain-containing protein [Paraburkholderia aspalathi]|nr:DUF2163 domain-containing protein [Paraburkholderia aspalathi]